MEPGNKTRPTMQKKIADGGRTPDPKSPASIAKRPEQKAPAVGVNTQQQKAVAGIAKQAGTKVADCIPAPRNSRTTNPLTPSPKPGNTLKPATAAGPASGFKDFGLLPSLLRAVEDAGYTAPTPIQANAIPHVLAGKDLLGCAQTGTGKTAAFALPILQRLSRKVPATIPVPRSSGKNPVAKRPIRALVLSPTRELAIQIEDSFKDYGKYTGLTSTVIFGGVGQDPQVNALQSGVDVLVATPGRLLDLMGQGYVSISNIEIFVLDEADRMLDMGFIHDVRRIVRDLPPSKSRQTLLFSATIPAEIVELAKSILHDPVEVRVSPEKITLDEIAQSIYFLPKKQKVLLLIDLLLKDKNITRALVFTRTKHGANHVVKKLAKASIPALAIHGNKSQTARQKALGDFKRGDLRVLVATDVASRGIDVDDISHVIQYDLPNVPETYIHRIGRTGRMGATGVAIAFCDDAEKDCLKDIEKLLKKRVPVVDDHPFKP
ncbi:MAG: DEAD/DEAH box helicase [Candidatus Sigynarchaeota archaeon]